MKNLKTWTALAAVMLAGLAAPMATASHQDCAALTESALSFDTERQGTFSAAGSKVYGIANVPAPDAEAATSYDLRAWVRSDDLPVDAKVSIYKVGTDDGHQVCTPMTGGQDLPLSPNEALPIYVFPEAGDYRIVVQTTSTFDGGLDFSLKVALDPSA